MAKTLLNDDQIMIVGIKWKPGRMQAYSLLGKLPNRRWLESQRDLSFPRKFDRSCVTHQQPRR